MTRKELKIICTNCGAPFHGTSECKRTVNGYDLLYVRVNAIADALADLAKYADSRNQPALGQEALVLYAKVLASTQTINVYAQPLAKPAAASKPQRMGMATFLRKLGNLEPRLTVDSYLVDAPDGFTFSDGLHCLAFNEDNLLEALADVSGHLPLVPCTDPDCGVCRLDLDASQGS